MILEYPNKKPINEILKKTLYTLSPCEANNNALNKLIFGDNLESLKSLLYNFNLSVDLIYIDPPFSTNNNFTIGDDRTSTISNSYSDKIAYEDKLKGSVYLEFLRERLILLREILSDSGSIYLHIDYKIGHYVKIMMDEIFGPQNFRNDITRIKCNPKNFSKKSYGNIKDMILFYTKSNNYIWNEPKIEISDSDVTRLFKKIDKDGRKYTTVPIHAPGETKNGESSKPFKGIFPPKGRHWRTNISTLEKLDDDGLLEWSKNNVPRKIIYADEHASKGKKLQDIWDFKDPQYPDYPTQKNDKLLNIIIESSSNQNSLVLDCFAGSGTTLVQSQLLNRNWVGIDNSIHSINVIKKRLEKISDIFTGYDYYTLLEQ